MNMGKSKIVSICISVAILLASFVAATAQIQNAGEYSGRATGINSSINVNGATVSTITGDTCPLPQRGGTSTVTTSGPLVAGVLSTGTIVSTTSGSGLTSQSSSSVSNFFLKAGSWTVTADNVTTRTQCSCCDVKNPSCSGETVITGLSVTDPSGAAFPITINGQADQVVTLPNSAGTITFNERSSAPGSITVNGMHINITSGGNNYNIVVASSHSDILCGALIITPADVNISGHIVDANGAAIRQATVTLTDDHGQVIRTTLSGLDGSYQITGVTSGQTYILQATQKSYTFQPKVLNVLDEMTDVNLVGARRTTLSANDR